MYLSTEFKALFHYKNWVNRDIVFLVIHIDIVSIFYLQEFFVCRYVNSNYDIQILQILYFLDVCQDIIAIVNADTIRSRNKIKNVLKAIKVYLYILFMSVSYKLISDIKWIFKCDVKITFHCPNLSYFSSQLAAL